MSQVLKIDDIIGRIEHLKNNDVDSPIENDIVEELFVNKSEEINNNKIPKLELFDKIYINYDNTSKLDNLEQISKKYDKNIDDTVTESSITEYKNIQNNNFTKIDSSIKKHYNDQLLMSKTILTSFGIDENEIEKNNMYKKIKKSGYGIFW